MKKLIIASTVLALGFASAQKSADVLNVVTLPDYATFDPAYCYETSCSAILYNTLEGLVGYAPNSTTQLVPLVAAQVPTAANGGISKDGKTYTFKIRPGAKFTNGQPVTAADVKYSILRFMVYSADVGAAGLLLEPLLGSADLLTKDTKVTFADLDKTVETPDANTIVFKLAKPFGPFLTTMVSFGFVYDKSEAVKAGDWDGTAATWKNFIGKAEGSTPYAKKPPVGTGPFTLERFDDGTSTIVLKRNDTYWRGPSKFSRIIIEGIKEDTTRIQKLQTGDADAAEAGGIPSAQLASVAKIPGVVVEKKPSLTLIALFMTQSINGEGTGYLGSGKLDGQGIPSNFFNDINVRKAFAASMDYKAIVGDILQGNGAQQNTVLIQGLPGYSKQQATYRFNKGLATQLFKNAHGGQVWTNGFSLPVFFNRGNSTRQRTLELLKKNIESLNPKFKIDVRELPFSEINAKAAKNQMTVWFSGWQADFPNTHTFAQPFLASAGLYARNINYKNPKADALIDEAVAETNLTKQTSLYRTISQIGFADVPFIATYQAVDSYVHRNNVKINANPVQNSFFYYFSKN